jgi:RNA polymerase sigma factor (TIGR02999 family)
MPPPARKFILSAPANVTAGAAFGLTVSNHDVKRLSRPAILIAMSDVTQILNAIEQGDPHATEQLLPLVYDELRKLAAQKMTQETPGQTLQATGLVHEAYLRLVDVKQAQQWNSRGHFFTAAAEAIRRILIDQARRKQSHRRGGGRRREDIEHVEIAAAEPSLDVLAVNEALERFEQVDPLKARLVKLRYFAGLTIPEAADALGISSTTADRHWAYARAWLHAELKKDASGPTG